MKSSNRQILARELADWHHSGLIDTPTARALAPRYDRHGQMLAMALKWLGLFAIFQLGLSVLSFIGVMSGSEAVGALLLTAASFGTAWWGVRPATDPLESYPITGSVLLSVALAGLFGAAVLAQLATGTEPSARSIAGIMLGVSAVATLTAYRFSLRWPLLLALLLGFHGLGSWHGYLGHGSYFAQIQEPLMMAPAALAVAGLGLWHERRVEQRLRSTTIGFGHLYLVLGLLYFNLSMWFLSLERGALVAVMLFSAGCLIQIVAGARAHDSRLTGFGIVFLSINLYTRFFERFWDTMSLATSLCVAGAAGMLIGYAIEARRTDS